LFFIAELAIATVGFVFPQKVTGIIEKHLTSKLIEFYREDPDLQNIIDFTQQEVLNIIFFDLLIDL
jgi:tetraspanin-33